MKILSIPHARRVRMVASVLGLWLTSTLAMSAPTYSVTNIGGLGGNYTLGQYINDAGLISGFSANSSNVYHAFVFDGATMTDLTPTSTGMTYAGRINNDGQLIYRDGLQSTFYDVTTNSATALAMPGVTLVNDAGVFAGTVVANAQQAQAFVLDAGVQTFLPSLGGTYTAATALSNAGQVSGMSYLSGATGDYRAFLYDGTTMTSIGTFGGTASAANDLNNLGQVVGYARTTNDAETHPFLYDSATGIMTDLGTLGTWLNNAYAINDHSQVVGVAYVQFANNTAGVQGTLYDNGTLYNLNDLIDPSSGWTIQAANDINNAGQIVATGFNAQLGLYNASVLLTPQAASPVSSVTEPGSLVLFGAGLLGLLGVRRRMV